LRATTAAREELEPCCPAARFDDAALADPEPPDCVAVAAALEDVELEAPPAPAVGADT
jgi:hypothetical protein